MKNCRVKIAGLQMAALCLFGMTALYAAQAKPATPAAKGAAPAAKGAAPAAVKATPESIANGETIYKRQCQTCHGATGVGDGPASKFLKGKLPNFTEKAAMAKIKDEDIHETVMNGVKTEVGTMPAFKTKLKPEEVQDVINFVHSFAK